ncbi:MAG: hypothetical protein KC944_19805, partial [Candidatus Omnitrophica bacterium]|nr:hypothetical protein [Candidatus Omnitrophota bacterium]
MNLRKTFNDNRFRFEHADRGSCIMMIRCVLNTFAIVLCLFANASLAQVIGHTDPGTGDYPASGMTELSSLELDIPDDYDAFNSPTFFYVHSNGRYGYLAAGDSNTPARILIIDLDGPSVVNTIIPSNYVSDIGRICSGQLVEQISREDQTMTLNQLWFTAEGINGTPGKAISLDLDENGLPIQNGSDYVLDSLTLSGQPANYTQMETVPRSPFTIQLAQYTKTVNLHWTDDYWEVFQEIAPNSIWWDKDTGEWTEQKTIEAPVGFFTLELASQEFGVEALELQDNSTTGTRKLCHLGVCANGHDSAELTTRGGLLGYYFSTPRERPVAMGTVDPLFQPSGRDGVWITVENTDTRGNEALETYAYEFAEDLKTEDERPLLVRNRNDFYFGSLDSSIRLRESESAELSLAMGGPSG